MQAFFPNPRYNVYIRNVNIDIVPTHVSFVVDIAKDTVYTKCRITAAECKSMLNEHKEWFKRHGNNMRFMWHVDGEYDYMPGIKIWRNRDNLIHRIGGPAIEYKPHPEHNILTFVHMKFIFGNKTEFEMLQDYDALTEIYETATNVFRNILTNRENMPISAYFLSDYYAYNGERVFAGPLYTMPLKLSKDKAVEELIKLKEILPMNDVGILIFKWAYILKCDIDDLSLRAKILITNRIDIDKLLSKSELAYLAECQ